MPWQYNQTSRLHFLELQKCSLYFDPNLNRTTTEDGWQPTDGISLSFGYTRGPWTVDERLEFDLRTGRYVVQTKAHRPTDNNIEFKTFKNPTPLKLQEHKDEILSAEGLPKELKTLVQRVMGNLS